MEASGQPVTSTDHHSAYSLSPLSPYDIVHTQQCLIHRRHAHTTMPASSTVVAAEVGCSPASNETSCSSFSSARRTWTRLLAHLTFLGTAIRPVAALRIRPADGRTAARARLANITVMSLGHSNDGARDLRRVGCSRAAHGEEQLQRAPGPQLPSSGRIDYDHVCICSQAKHMKIYILRKPFLLDYDHESVTCSPAFLVPPRSLSLLFACCQLLLCCRCNHLAV